MNGFQVSIIIAMVVAIALGFIWLVNRQEKERPKVKKDDRAEKAEADKLRQLRDHQLNHGRRVYNWLCGLKFPEYISIIKIEDNGGRFLIFIGRNHEGYSNAAPLVQLSYDFVSKHNIDREGHVHYGVYGADADFRILDHADFNFGLEDLVVKHVRWEVREYEERLAKF